MQQEVAELLLALLRQYPFDAREQCADLASQLDDMRPLHMTTTTGEGWVFVDAADARSFFTHQCRVHVLRMYRHCIGESEKWGDLAYLRRLKKFATPYIEDAHG